MTTYQTKQGNVTVRPMEFKDINAIFDIDRSLIGEERAGTLLNLVPEDLTGTLNLSLIAEIENRLVGFILARHTYIGEPIIEAGLIQGLGIHPLYQKQGIGAQLVDALTKHCQSNSISTIRVILSEKDSRLESFFSHMGFSRAKLIVCDKKL